MAVEPDEAGKAAAQPEDEDAAPSPTAVNSQIVDAVTMMNALAVGQAPATAAGMLNLMTADTLALGMLNAVARQQADAMVASAAMAATCARLAGTRLAGGPAQDVVAAEAQAQAAILTIRIRAAAADGEAAKAALQRIAEAAAADPAGGPGAAAGRTGR